MVNCKELFLQVRGEGLLLACGFSLQTVTLWSDARDPIAWPPGGDSCILWATDPQPEDFNGFRPGAGESGAEESSGKLACNQGIDH